MLSADLYESKGVSVNNFVQTLPPVESDYAQEIIKDPYHFDFLSLTAEYKEKDLQHELESNISRFLIELGDGFAYVGRQVKLDINGDEYYCDLLFYHLRLRRYIVVELKTGKFEPEFVSKLNLYCTAVDHVYKTDIDGDTIGLLICKEKNDLVAQWTVEKSQQPIAITRYELDKILSK
jgi:predicted nuclease of restriction endonuclease-like (RecB) superfamily